jgi:hypothetical protein
MVLKHVQNAVLYTICLAPKCECVCANICHIDSRFLTSRMSLWAYCFSQYPMQNNWGLSHKLNLVQFKSREFVLLFVGRKGRVRRNRGNFIMYVFLLQVWKKNWKCSQWNVVNDSKFVDEIDDEHTIVHKWMQWHHTIEISFWDAILNTHELSYLNRILCSWINLYHTHNFPYGLNWRSMKLCSWIKYG